MVIWIGDFWLIFWKFPKNWTFVITLKDIACSIEKEMLCIVFKGLNSTPVFKTSASEKLRFLDF